MVGPIKEVREDGGPKVSGLFLLRTNGLIRHTRDSVVGSFPTETVLR